MGFFSNSQEGDPRSKFWNDQAGNPFEFPKAEGDYQPLSKSRINFNPVEANPFPYGEGVLGTPKGAIPQMPGIDPADWKTLSKAQWDKKYSVWRNRLDSLAWKPAKEKEWTTPLKDKEWTPPWKDANDWKPSDDPGFVKWLDKKKIDSIDRTGVNMDELLKKHPASSSIWKNFLADPTQANWDEAVKKASKPPSNISGITSIPPEELDKSFIRNMQYMDPETGAGPVNAPEWTSSAKAIKYQGVPPGIELGDEAIRGKATAYGKMMQELFPPKNAAPKPRWYTGGPKKKLPPIKFLGVAAPYMGLIHDLLPLTPEQKTAWNALSDTDKFVVIQSRALGIPEEMVRKAEHLEYA